MIQPGADAIVPDDPPPEPPQEFIELNTESRLTIRYARPPN
jgi:hypothetical protein